MLNFVNVPPETIGFPNSSMCPPRRLQVVQWLVQSIRGACPDVAYLVLAALVGEVALLGPWSRQSQRPSAAVRHGVAH